MQALLMKVQYQWHGIGTVQALSYTCGYCGHLVAPNQGLAGKNRSTGHIEAQISVCHHCSGPTMLEPDSKGQVPSPRRGVGVTGIDDPQVSDLYDEARATLSASCPTATVLCCRKLLMHIAVSKGADSGLKFIQYVDHLIAKNFVPPDAKEWIDHIRKAGNEANHEIEIATMSGAEEVLSFCQMLLTMIFEFPAKIRSKKG